MPINEHIIWSRIQFVNAHDSAPLSLSLGYFWIVKNFHLLKTSPTGFYIYVKYWTRYIYSIYYPKRALILHLVLPWLKLEFQIEMSPFIKKSPQVFASKLGHCLKILAKSVNVLYWSVKVLRSKDLFWFEEFFQINKCFYK
jgi:hypothetical protein